MRTVAFCECEPYCRAVLRKHWPDIPCYPDVRELTATRLLADGISVDIVCGGFPCQDISIAGTGAGLEGARSGLWSEFARLVGEIRPRYVIVENVAALLARGVDRVLGDLATLGFDAEWHCVSASYIGAPHRRDRVWIVAYASSDTLRNEQQRMSGRRPHGICEQRKAIVRDDGAKEPLADTYGGRCQGKREPQHAEQQSALRSQPDGCSTRRSRPRSDVADACGARLSLSEREELRREERHDEGRATAERGWWSAEPAMGVLVNGVSPDMGRFAGRVARDVPDRVPKLTALGNAVVPQIPEMIGRAILRLEAADEVTAEV